MIRGFLFDLDGVFYVSNRILKGANETIDWLINNKIPYRFITNTTTMSREKITKKLVNLGLKIRKTDIISANYAGAIYLKKINPASCKLILREEAKEDYVEFNIQNKAYAIDNKKFGSNWNHFYINFNCDRFVMG